jgi:hypothetical protein
MRKTLAACSIGASAAILIISPRTRACRKISSPPVDELVLVLDWFRSKFSPLIFVRLGPRRQGSAVVKMLSEFDQLCNRGGVTRRDYLPEAGNVDLSLSNSW